MFGKLLGTDQIVSRTFMKIATRCTSKVSACRGKIAGETDPGKLQLLQLQVIIYATLAEFLHELAQDGSLMK